MRRVVTTWTGKLVVLAALPGLVGLTTVPAAHAAGVLGSSGGLSGSANLVRGGVVVPGVGRDFAVEVANTSRGLSILGPSIDYVNVTLPSAAGVTTNPSVEAPAGWSVAVTDAGSLQAVTFRAAQDGGIRPGEELVFAFPADVAAPESADQTGVFRVAVSDDGGRTTQRAGGELSTVVKVLEVVSLGAVAPPGVVDQTATSAMEISYQVRVRNHARRMLTVTPSLSSSGHGDTIGRSRRAKIAADGTRAFDFPVTLGTMSSGQGTSTFTAGATAPRAEAAARSANLVVQAAPVLDLVPGSLRPEFVRSDPPLRYEFTVAARRSNPPALTVNKCRLSFARTKTRLAAPVRFSDDGRRTLRFRPTIVHGDDGRYPARVQCSGVDGNGVAHSYDLRLPDAVTIDNGTPR